MSILAANPCTSKAPTIWTLGSLEDFDRIKQPQIGDIATFITGEATSFWTFQAPYAGETDGFFAIAGGCQGAWVNGGSAINVVLFGADPTGVEDSTEAIEAAQDALPITGGTLFFPIGSYRFNLVINKNNVIIDGTGFAKSMAAPTTANKFIPADTSLPLIQVGNNTALINGFQMRNCSLSGFNGSGTYGTVGIRFMSAWQCFLSNVAVRDFDVNFWMENGSAYPVSLIWVTGFVSQSNGNANCRAFKIRWVDAGSFTTAVFLETGHIDQPEGANSYVIELDGVVLGMSNIYVDCGVADNGVRFLWTLNPGGHVPFIEASNVHFDHQGASPIFEVDRLIAAWSNYIYGVATINGTLKLADATIVAQPDGQFFGPAKSSYLLPALLGRIAIMALGTDLAYTDAKRIEALAAVLNIINDGGDITLDPSTQVNISGAPLVLDNEFAISLKSSAGVVEETIQMSAADNLQLASPTAAGGIQITARNAGGSVNIFTAANQAASFDGNGTAGNTRLSLYDADSALVKRVKVGANGTGPGGVGRALFVDDV